LLDWETASETNNRGFEVHSAGAIGLIGKHSILKMDKAQRLRCTAILFWMKSLFRAPTITD